MDPRSGVRLRTSPALHGVTLLHVAGQRNKLQGGECQLFVPGFEFIDRPTETFRPTFPFHLHLKLHNSRH